jgi:hypothetical protein
MAIGKQLQTLKQAINIKHSIDPKSKKPNPRTPGQPTQSEGANKNRTINIDRRIEQYRRN